MKLKIKPLRRRSRVDGTLLPAGQADHIIQSGGFQQDALKRLAGTQPRRAVRFRPSCPQHHQTVVKA